MDEANRFAPPATSVADVASDAVQPVRLWPPSGRIGRLRFLAYGLGLYVLFIVAAFVFGFVSAMVGKDSVLMTALGMLGLLAYLFAAFVLVQRSHDMDMSGWWSIAAMIPIVGLVWVFKGGTRGVNRWGAPPPPNGVVVTIAGLLLPVIVVVGIVAAVALPAYQQAATRGVAGSR